VNKSWTVTVKFFVERFDAASLAVHVTVVVPTRNTEPLAGLQRTDTTPTASVAVGVV